MSKNTKGLQLKTRQNLLSRSAVISQASNGPINNKVYPPTATLAHVAVNAGRGHFFKTRSKPMCENNSRCFSYEYGYS